MQGLTLAGIDIRTIQLRLGQRNLKTTMVHTCVEQLARHTTVPLHLL